MTTPVAKHRVRRPRSAVVLTISLLVLALVGAGCTGGGDGDGEDRAERRGPDRTGREVALDVRIGEVAGGLPKARRKVVARQVGGVVDGWFEAAYLDGDYPRRSFQGSWPRFTRDARRLATRDRVLTSNAGIGRRTRSVVPRRKLVRVDVLAWNGRPRAATARFRLVFDARAARTSRHKVEGRLMLVLDGKTWRVVGYDVRRSQRGQGGGKR